MDLESKLKQLIISSVDNSDINLTGLQDFHLMNDLGFDSFQIINLVMSIENEFNFQFDDDALDIDLVCQYSELIKIVRNATNL